MFLPFNSLPKHSRIWIYQADKKITEEQKIIISEGLLSFTQQWQVHGAPMETSFDIRYDQFIILAANDQASGCSIDGSVRTIKALGESLGIGFFNRDLIPFLREEQITLVPLKELKRKLEEGYWNSETITFNNLVNNKGELEASWKMPAGSSWLKRYLPKEALT